MKADPIKVLLVESNPIERKKLAEILVGTKEIPIKTTQKSSLKTALSILKENKFDLILLSVQAGAPQRSLSINEIRTAVALNLPLIILLDRVDRNFSNQTLQLGAQECLFINKLDPQLFFQAINYAIKFKKMEMALQKMEGQLAKKSRLQTRHQEYHDLLLALMEETTDTIFVKDNEGRFLLLNSTAAANLGKRPEEMIGKTNRDLPIPRMSKKSMEDTDQAVFQTGKSISYEVTLNGPKGPRTMFTTKSPFRDRQGKITGLIGISRDITHQKLVEETLRTEHAYRKPIEEAMLAGVVAMANITRKIIYVSPAFCKIVGWSEQELLGQTPPFPFWPPEDTDKIFEILKNRFQTASPPEIEISFQKRDGERFPVLIKSAPLTDGHGNKIGMVSTIADITNQKVSETRLRESHNLLRSIVEGTLDSIYLIDLNGRYLMINSSASRILGKPPEEIIGKHMSDFFSPRYVRIFEEKDRMILSSGKIDTSETVIMINGTDHTFLTTRGPVRNHEDKIIGFFGISRDITEKKSAEEILQKSEQRLRAVVDNSTAVIYMKDLEGNYLLVNKKFKELFLISKNEVVGRTDYDIFPVELAEKFRAHDQEVIKKKAPLEFDETAPHADGIHYYISVKFPLMDNHGDIYAICGISTDITDRRNREEDNMKIEKLESLGLLAGGIAHDFNNILTAVLGNISLAKSFLESRPQLLNRLNEAERATLRASELAKQLLTFSKGGAPIKKIVSIQTLIEHSIQFALTGSNVLSRHFFQEGLWPIEADEGQIIQVIQNLTINAKQAMPSGGVIQIEASNHSVEDSGDHEIGIRTGNYLLIAIKDQGIGIPKEHLPKIFDPYFTTKSNGSGLGLSITHSIIKRHQGYITAESNSDGGTTFLIYLPAAPLAVIPQEIVEADSMTRGNGRILVVDDEESILGLAGEILTHLGYSAELTNKGTEAVHIYKKELNSGHPFDLVITDLTIPGDIGGVEILQKLRDLEPRVKVIVSSGYSNDPALADFNRFGFSECLKKPYRAFEVSEAVKRVLKTRRAGD